MQALFSSSLSLQLTTQNRHDSADRNISRAIFSGGSDEPHVARLSLHERQFCNHGADLTCAKGDVSCVSKGTSAWCKDPARMLRHATMHTWTCVRSAARIKQSEKLDARGFIANQWAPLEK
jgi:hypothetical protein